MSDPRDYGIDLRQEDGAQAPCAGAANAPPRPYLSVHFACCGVYRRIYRSADGKGYHGRCPRCTVPVRFVVGEGGTRARSFVAR